MHIALAHLQSVMDPLREEENATPVGIVIEKLEVNPGFLRQSHCYEEGNIASYSCLFIRATH